MSLINVSDWTPPGWLIPWISRTHVVLYKLSAGKVGSHVDGMPCIVLRTIGRRSGKPHTVCLSYLPDGDSMVVVGSFGGAEHHPAWYHNLQGQSRGDRARPGTGLLGGGGDSHRRRAGRPCGSHGSPALPATPATRDAPTGRSP